MAETWGTVLEMETDRLRWFLAVAERAGIREAAAQLHVSAGAVSKAMADLEKGLGQPLFVRSPRGFSLTEAGVYLRGRATELVRIEDEMREELHLGKSPQRLTILGTEPLIALHLAALLELTRARFPDVAVDLRPTRDDAETRKLLDEHPASLAVVTETSRAESSRPLPPAPFGTFVGLSHPLAPRAETGAAVADVIAHAFVVPARAVFGPMPSGASTDGWRDDAFPRSRRVVAPTLALVEAYVEAGRAIAYLPRHLAKRMRARQLKVTGCPYSCTVESHVIRAEAAPGWVRQLV
jgi:DNA-binding transcriptional LysR family regulator